MHGKFDSQKTRLFSPFVNKSNNITLYFEHICTPLSNFCINQCISHMIDGQKIIEISIDGDLDGGCSRGLKLYFDNGFAFFDQIPMISSMVFVREQVESENAYSTFELVAMFPLLSSQIHPFYCHRIASPSNNWTKAQT